jgi:hypothetical protein
MLTILLSPGFSPVIAAALMVLQTLALPLGHDAMLTILLSPGFSPVIAAALMVLQTLALPLGHDAMRSIDFQLRIQDC